MTAKKNFKRLVRARARQTGESYAAAFRSLRKGSPEVRPMAAASPSSRGVPPLRRVEKPELGFALLVPHNWRDEPPDPFNSAQEIARFTGPGLRERGCFVFRNHPRPGITARAAAEGLVPVLERGGFGNFTHHDATIGGVPASRLEFEKRTGSRLRSFRDYYVVVGDTPIVLSFSIPNPDQDAPLIDMLAATFSFLQPGTLPPPVPPAVRVPEAQRGRYRRYELPTRRVLTVAHQEATRRGVPIDQQHLLAGLAAVAETGASDLLALYGLSHEELQRALRMLLPTLSAADAAADARGAPLRLSERAERTLQAAEREATAPGNAAVRAEHLLLALLQVPGPVHDLLTERGITPDRVRAAAGVLAPEPVGSESPGEPSPLLDNLTARAARVLREARQGVPRRFNHS